MGAPVFGNEFFDQWLNQKSNDILSKVEREKISNEDMLILSLKAQVNHFHHMDIEFRNEFVSIHKEFSLVNDRFEQVDKRFEQVDKRFEQVDKRFDLMDKRFERMTTVMMWGFGILTSMLTGVLFKLV
jgi:predicted  nucleic acid-binding Zn-ribbon protein